MRLWAGDDIDESEQAGRCRKIWSAGGESVSTNGESARNKKTRVQSF